MSKISGENLSRIELQNLKEARNFLWLNPVLPAIGIAFFILLLSPFFPIIPSKFDSRIVNSFAQYWSEIKLIVRNLPMHLLWAVIATFVYHYARDLRLCLDLTKDMKSDVKRIGHFRILDKKRFGSSYRIKTDDLNVKWIKVNETLYKALELNSEAKIIFSVSNRAYRSDFKEKKFRNDHLI